MSVALEEAIVKALKPQKDEVKALDSDIYDLKCLFSLTTSEFSGGTLGTNPSTAPKEVNELIKKIKENSLFKRGKKETYESRNKELSLGDQLIIDNARCITTSIHGFMEHMFNHPELLPGYEHNLFETSSPKKKKERFSKEELTKLRKETFNIPNLLTALYGIHTNHFEGMRNEILEKFEVDISERFKIGIYSQLENNVRPIDGNHRNPNANYDRAFQRKFNEVFYQLTALQHNPTNESARERARKELKPIRHVLADYLNSTGDYKVLTAKSLPFKLELGGPDEDVSTWTDDLRLMTLEADALFIHGKEKSVCKALWLPTVLHEATHARATDKSNRLSKSLQAGTSSFMEFGPATIEEGRAMYMEEETTSWLEKNASKYSVSEKDMDLIKMYPRAYLQSRAIGILRALALKQEMTVGGRTRYEGEQFAAAYLANVAEFPPIYLDPAYWSDEGFLDAAIYRINYPVGTRYVKNTMGLVEKVLGKEHYEANKNFLHQAMLTGQWSPGAHEQYMLRLVVPLIKEHSKK